MSHVTYATQVLSCMYFNSKYDLNTYQVLVVAYLKWSILPMPIQTTTV